MRSWTVTPVIVLLLAACGEQPAAKPAAAASQGSTLTPWQLEHGVGPITEALPPIANATHEAAEGKKRFDQICASCHKPNERYVGPALGGVVERRSQEYVMNMILAPDTMVARHPEAKKMMAAFMLQMPNMGLTKEQAREVVEYLRTLPAPPAP